MGHMRLMGAVLLAAMFATAGASLEAGVKGSKFAGTFTNNLNQTADCTLNFRTNGSMVQTQDFGGGVQSFNGSYQEFDFGFISFWSGGVTDGSPNGSGSHSGISLFGVFTTLTIINEEIDIRADGFLFKTGAATREAVSSSGGTSGAQ